jgi:hypothetical protein
MNGGKSFAPLSKKNSNFKNVSCDGDLWGSNRLHYSLWEILEKRVL